MTRNATSAAIRAELTKITSLRITSVLLVLTCAVSVVLSYLGARSVRDAFDRGSTIIRPDYDPINASYIGLAYAQILLIAFGVLIVGSEYSSGTIRAALAAVPGRGRFYAAKILAAVPAVVVVAAITAGGGFVATQLGLGRHGVSLVDGDGLRTVAGATGYLLLMYLIAVGVTTVLRSTALSLAILIVLIMVVTPLANQVPGLREAARFLPDHAGRQLMTIGAQADPAMGPLPGLLVTVAWTACALGAGYVVVRSHDA